MAKIQQKNIKLNSYELSRRFFDWCFENPEVVKPNHIALYFFAVEHCNRLGWKQKFGLPTEMAKDAIGIKSWHTYIAAFNDLVDWGFFKLYERSKNQYSSNIIALIKNDEAHDEALDKAIAKHMTKHQRSTYQSTHQSNDSILKPITNTTKEHEKEEITPEINRGILLEISEVAEFLKTEDIWMEQTVCMRQKITRENAEIKIDEFVEMLKDRAEETKTPKDAKEHFINWLKKNISNEQNRSNNTKGARKQHLIDEFNSLVSQTS